MYANFNSIDVRVTYFDINESFLATVAAFVAGWILVTEHRKLSLKLALFYWSVVIVELLIVMFSQRRTSWGGLVLASGIFVVLLPSRQRWIAFILGFPVVVAGVMWAMSKRLGSAVATQGWFGALFDDVGAGNQFRALGERELELRLGMNSFLSSPVIGNGTWARYYDGFVPIQWQTGEEAFLWLHSTWLHLAFKTGIVGLALFGGMVIAFAWWVVRRGRLISEEWRGTYFAGLAGLLFYLPGMLYGPSIVEYRTMQLFFFAMALPFLVDRAIGKR